jgi:tetrahydromethanopterin S-methyltransferase subunit G
MPRESWTDGRLDEIAKRMDERFDRVDERVKAVRGEMKEEFTQVDKRLDRLADGLESVQKAIVFGSITMSSAFVPGLIAFVFQG